MAFKSTNQGWDHSLCKMVQNDISLESFSSTQRKSEAFLFRRQDIDSSGWRFFTVPYSAFQRELKKICNACMGSIELPGGHELSYTNSLSLHGIMTHYCINTKSLFSVMYCSAVYTNRPALPPLSDFISYTSTVPLYWLGAVVLLTFPLWMLMLLPFSCFLWSIPGCTTAFIRCMVLFTLITI